MTADVLLAIAIFCSNYDKPESVKCQGNVILCYEANPKVPEFSDSSLRKCVLRQLVQGTK